MPKDRLYNELYAYPNVVLDQIVLFTTVEANFYSQSLEDLIYRLDLLYTTNREVDITSHLEVSSA